MENRRSLMTKRLLMESFFELLEDMPINKITVKALCEKADLNRSTFYLHYETVDDLINDIGQGWIDHQVKELGIVKEGDITIPFIMKRLEAISSSPKVYLRLLEDAHLIQMFIKGLNNYYRVFVEGYDKIYDEYVVEFILNGNFSVARKWLENNCEEPIERIAEIIFSLTHALTYKTADNQ